MGGRGARRPLGAGRRGRRGGAVGPRARTLVAGDRPGRRGPARLRADDAGRAAIRLDPDATATDHPAVAPAGAAAFEGAGLLARPARRRRRQPDARPPRRAGPRGARGGPAGPDGRPGAGPRVVAVRWPGGQGRPPAPRPGRDGCRLARPPALGLRADPDRAGRGGCAVDDRMDRRRRSPGAAAALPRARPGPGADRRDRPRRRGGAGRAGRLGHAGDGRAGARGVGGGADDPGHGEGPRRGRLARPGRPAARRPLDRRHDDGPARPRPRPGGLPRGGGPPGRGRGRARGPTRA